MSGLDALERPGAFGMYVRRLHDVIANQLEDSLVAAGSELKGTTTTIIWLLHFHGPLSLTDISKQLRYSHQLATQRVAWLKQRNFVRIVPDPSDKRRKIISLTHAGTRECKLFEGHVAALEQAYEEVFAEIGVDAMDVVRRVESALLNRSLKDRIQRDVSRAA